MPKSEKTLKEKLTPLQYEVTQKDGTEEPFNNEYWDNKEEGIYVDIVSGEPLFSSVHKYDSGTGWPSFYQPLEPNNLITKDDHTHGRIRTEVRSKTADSHLGHLFDDGPKPTGKRYCMNSASLRFIKKAELEKEGYGKYRALFEKTSSTQEAIAYFAGGCFWCTQKDFLKIRGVKNVEAGYMGGSLKNPSYDQVSSGTTGHAESVRVIFNKDEVSYEDLLKVFWLSIDPTVVDQQFCDVGPQYRTAIFYTDDDQKKAAIASQEWLKKNFPHLNLVVEITPAKTFYPAEGYHQRYADKNPLRYESYRKASGRDQRIDQLYRDKREEILENLKKK